jgi:hypothetical protein
MPDKSRASCINGNIFDSLTLIISGNRNPQGENMNSRISDLALDLGVFALDYEIENGVTFEAYSLGLLPALCA